MDHRSLVIKGRTAVFPHRGLSRPQFTPMSGAHQLMHWTAGFRPVTFRKSLARRRVMSIVRRQSMSHTEALALIHAEAGESGLHVAARMGDDLDPTRVARLVSAIRTIASSLRGAQTLGSQVPST